MCLPIPSRRTFALTALLCTPLLLASGCSTNPATGEQSFTALMSPEQEIRIGREEHPKLVEQFGGEYSDADLAAYVNRIGQALATLSDNPELPYTFTVLNEDTVNAFALPGGFVYVSRGLLALAEDEAEVAGVLAHEIGHVVARHSAQRYSQSVAANVGLTVLGVIGGAFGVPSQLGQMASFGAAAYLQGFSREQELEADMLGVRYLARAGYDPQAMTSFLTKMREHARLEAVLAGRDPSAVDQYNIMATHPRTIERIEQAVDLAGAAVPARPIRNTERYLSTVNGMVYGDDPKQGVRQGRDFLHPDLRFAFTVPEGFVLFNGQSRVQARGPDSAGIVFDAAPAQLVRQSNDPMAVLRTWSGDIALSGVERIEVNGMAGATGRAQIRTNNGPRDLRLVTIRQSASRVYRFLFITPTNVTARLQTEFQRTTYSFRQLSADEAANIRPLRIVIHTVQAGDTVESLAATMPFASYRLERFETLNGLSRGQPLTPGQTVKLVRG